MSIKRDTPKNIKIDTKKIIEKTVANLASNLKIFNLAKSATTPEILATFGNSRSTMKNEIIQRWSNSNFDNVKTENLTKNVSLINLHNADGIEFASVFYSSDLEYDVTIHCKEKELQTNLDWYEKTYIPKLLKRVIEFTI